MALIHLNEEGFDKALSSGVPMLVDFWATWCTHCKPLGPIFEQLGEEYEGKNVLIGKVDVDEAPEIWDHGRPHRCAHSERERD